jgi:serine/threonine protein kinase
MLTGQTPFYSRDRERLFNNILTAEVVYPPHLSPEAVDLLQQLFLKNPNERLGSGPDGADEIKSHVWFRNINWIALFRKQVTPPFVPRISGPLDLHNFDEVRNM